jgi:hypothetical protein
MAKKRHPGVNIVNKNQVIINTKPKRRRAPKKKASSFSPYPATVDHVGTFIPAQGEHTALKDEVNHLRIAVAHQHNMITNGQVFQNANQPLLTNYSDSYSLPSGYRHESVSAMPNARIAVPQTPMSTRHSSPVREHHTGASVMADAEHWMKTAAEPGVKPAAEGVKPANIPIRPSALGKPTRLRGPTHETARTFRPSTPAVSTFFETITKK